MDIFFYVNFTLILFIVVIVAYSSVKIQEVATKLDRYDTIFYKTARYQYAKINDFDNRLELLESSNAAAKKEGFEAKQHDTPLGIMLDMYENLLDAALLAATADPYFRAISQHGEPMHSQAIKEHESLGKFIEFRKFVDKHQDMIHNPLYKDMFAGRFATVLKKRKWSQADVDLLVDRVNLYETSFQGLKLPSK